MFHCVPTVTKLSAIDASLFLFLQVLARDEDFGTNGEVTYSIRPSASSDNFRINETTGQLYTARAIDRETLQGNIIVNILAKDGGGREGTCPLFVKINDVNDNPPEFPEQAYNFNIQNDLPVDSSAFQVRATDKDQGQNAVVMYSLVSNPGGYFYIDKPFERTGIVKVNQTLPDDEVGYLNNKELYNQTNIWASPWENVSYVICEQQRHRSACASADSISRL